MPDASLIIVALAAGLALAALGAGLYEYVVVDRAWPQQLALIQPQRGGISRKRFWIPAHLAYELALIVALIATWGAPAVRTPLLVALASHAAMRLWSVFDLIPKALAFEHADADTIDQDAARRWRRRSLARLPLDLVTCAAMLAAFVATARLGA